MEEIELRQYWAIIRKRIAMVLLIPIIAAIVSALASMFLIHPQWSADTTLLVNQKSTSADLGLAYQGIMTDQALVNTYSQLIKSQTIEQETIKRLNLPYTPAAIGGMVNVSAPNQSQVIDLNVTAPSEKLAVDIANTMAQVFEQKAQTWMSIKNVHVIDPAIASPNASPVKPNKKLNVAIAFILGLMVSVGLAFLLEYLDTRIRTEEDVQRLLELPVLGTILEYGPES